MVEFDDGVAATEVPDHGIVETDVLIVGSGPSGGRAALAMATYGIANPQSERIR